MEPDRKKIMYVISGTDIGGAQTILIEQLKHLDSSKYEAEVISLTPIGDAGRIMQKYAPVLCFFTGFKFNPLMAVKIFAEIRKFKPDIVHSHLVHANILARILGKLAGVPFIISTIHNENVGGWLRELALRLTKKFSSVDVVVSEKIKSDFLDKKIVDGNKMRVVLNGIDTAHFAPAPDCAQRHKQTFSQNPPLSRGGEHLVTTKQRQSHQSPSLRGGEYQAPTKQSRASMDSETGDCFGRTENSGLAMTNFGEFYNSLKQDFGIRDDFTVFVSVGRLTEQKAYQFLLEAAKKLLKKRKDFIVLILGDGEERGKLQKQIADSNLEKHVLLVGNVSNVNSYLQMADAFVLSSLWEGLPMALLEAMSSGAIPIVTKVGGVPEVVVPKENGFLVEPGESEDLFETMLDFMRMKKTERSPVSQKARETVVRQYSVERMVAEYEEIYSRASEA